jgi:hypothetical protein
MVLAAPGGEDEEGECAWYTVYPAMRRTTSGRETVLRGIRTSRKRRERWLGGRRGSPTCMAMTTSALLCRKVQCPAWLTDRWKGVAARGHGKGKEKESWVEAPLPT